MGWEKFTQVGKSYKPKISIRSNGQLGFNFGSIEKFSLSKYSYAVLFFDPDTKRIGIRLTQNKAEDGVCKLQVRSTNGTISAKSFLDYYSIDYEKTKRFDAVWDPECEMITAKIG